MKAHNIQAILAPGIYLIAAGDSKRDVHSVAHFVAHTQHQLQMRVVERLIKQRQEPDEVCLDINMN